ncbi:MAG: 50S ribosomal protein L32e [Nitrososphaeria archaeon]|nr:50S ribosomal protein L32e [Nitrososphaeria archaeon]
MSEVNLRKNVVKIKKPKFVRPESWRYVRIKPNWRRPKGIDHKVRKEYKGWPARVKVGYRAPKAIRGLHPSGFKEVLVHNIQELLKLDPKVNAARIAHTVGTKKRIEIFEKAKELGIHVLNPVRLKKVES